MPNLDLTDPCAVLAELRAAQIALMTGERIKELRHNNKVIIRQDADPKALAALIADYDRQCAARSGGVRGRRSVITAG
jgi:glucose-6-phosphate isomerase